MKTGIVRRIDELGRVVIPKEIRRTMRLKEGEEMEVYVAGEDELVLKKYSQVKNMSDFCKEYAGLLYRHTGYNCAVCDTSCFVVSATEREYFSNRNITRRLEEFLQERKGGYFRTPEAEAFLPDCNVKEVAAAPIVVNGDVIGGILMASKTAMSMPDAILRHLEIAADFLSRQTE